MGAFYFYAYAGLLLFMPMITFLFTFYASALKSFFSIMLILISFSNPALVRFLFCSRGCCRDFDKFPGTYPTIHGNILSFEVIVPELVTLAK